MTDEAMPTGSMDDYESELRFALSGLTTARQRLIEEPGDDHEVDAWSGLVHRTALGLALAVNLSNGRLDPDDRQRLDNLLASTPETRQAVLVALADHSPDAYEWTEPDDPDTHMHYLNWRMAWARETKADAEWLCEPIIAAGRGHAVFAKAGEGKSWTVLAAALALATGRAFLSRRAGPIEHVVYLDYEMVEDDLMDRVMGFGYTPDDDLSALHYALIPELPPLDTAEGGRAILEQALRHHAALVVVDTTGRALAGEENDNDAIRAFYEHTGKRLKAAGIALVRLDHAGHGDVGHARGASAKNDDVDIVWQVKRTDDGQAWKATKRRVGWVAPKFNLVITEGNDGVHRFTSDDNLSYPAGTKELADLLDVLGVPLDMSRRVIRREYGDRFEARNDVLAAAIRYRREQAELP